jgi:hypothetical protein
MVGGDDLGLRGGDPRARGRKQPGPDTGEIWTATAAVALRRVEVNMRDDGTWRGPWLGRDEVRATAPGLCLLLV